MPPRTRSVRFIPRKKVMNALITAWANSAKSKEYKEIYNSLNLHEKKYVNNIGFGPGPNNGRNNTRRALNPNSAAFYPAPRALNSVAKPLNPNAVPFETAANRRAALNNLAASGSKLPRWISE